MARFELLSISIILAISLQQAMALKCYQCSTNNDPKCAIGDKLTTEYSVECHASYKEPVCFKMHAGATNLIQRTCEPDQATAEKNCKESEAQDKDTVCGICNTEHCNGAPVQYGSAAVVIVIPIAIMKFLSL